MDLTTGRDIRERCFSKESPAIVEFAYPKPLSAKDDDGTIVVHEAIEMSSTVDKTELRVIPIVEYGFSKPTELTRAVAKIASARNLFSFFADYHIPLENITFTDEPSGYCNIALHMNEVDDVDIPEKPFIIQTAVFRDDFDRIWNNWTLFYDSGSYIPDLFYEVLCNRSTGTNRFLNLAQAIELYSNRCRDTEAWKISGQKKRRDSHLPLKYRVQDILTWLNAYLDFTDTEIDDLARKISDYRNFFTHYNTGRYREPSFQEMCSSSRVLQFILLSVVYKTVGIADEHIRKSRRFYSYGSLDRDIGIVMARPTH